MLVYTRLHTILRENGLDLFDLEREEGKVLVDTDFG